MIRLPSEKSSEPWVTDIGEDLVSDRQQGVSTLMCKGLAPMGDQPIWSERCQCQCFL